MKEEKKKIKKKFSWACCCCCFLFNPFWLKFCKKSAIFICAIHFGVILVLQAILGIATLYSYFYGIDLFDNTDKKLVKKGGGKKK